MNDERIEQLKAKILDAATQLIVEVLRRDAELHERGEFASMGEYYDDLDSHWPRCSNADQLGIAWTFYDLWISARDHNFMQTRVAQDDWPKYARSIADTLAAGGEITDPVLLEEFVYRRRTSLIGALKSMLGLKPKSEQPDD